MSGLLTSFPCSSLRPTFPYEPASASVADRWLFWGRARLYANRLVLTGWGLRGHYRQRILLREIEEIDPGARRLRLGLRGEARVVITVDDAREWARSLRGHRRIFEARR